ncbi:MAG: polysaccharide biosynthesis/export family protein, partial [Planctomycetaceae bacterium]|nr:polysaccharide biosynthesis/export family protein [Planctomycetaceae bacterium]
PAAEGEPAPAPAAAPPGGAGKGEAPPSGGLRVLEGGGAVIRAGDTLDISVFGHAELSKEAKVQPDGTIYYPFLGQVVVKGEKVGTVSEAIAAALERDLRLRLPKVSVAVTSFAPRTVFILGRVASSGSHEIPVTQPLSLLQLVSLAGGFLEDADRARILVQRIDEKTGGKGTLVFNLAGMEKSGDLSGDPVLQDQDTVIVPKAEEISVIGQVTDPGTFYASEGVALTLLRAVARAKGFTRLGKSSAVIWKRKTARGFETQTVDADAIIEGTAPDPVLGPGDVLFVPERAW